MDNKNLKIHFAPLQGYTDHIYRNAHNEIFGGIDYYYTPFVRLEKGDSFRSRELRDIEPENNKVPNLIPQLVASSKDEMIKVCELLISKGYKKIDINMGCPFPMIARKLRGSGILAHPERVKELMDVVKSYPDIEFSVKMRLGWDSPEESFALIDILNDAPLSQIAIHPRLGKQQYKGEIDIISFKHLYENLKHPVIYNGDILNIDDIERISNEFPNLAGIMIGRGLLANPALGFEYKQNLKITPEEMKKKLKALHKEVFEHYAAYLQGDKQLLEKMKHFWEYFTKDLEKRTRKKIEKAGKVANYDAAVALAFSQWGKISQENEDED